MMMNDAGMIKILEASTEAIDITTEDLALINRFALTPLTEDAVYVRRMRLANDRVDRDFERFPLSYLQRFAETIPGKSVLIGHDQGSAPLGLFFKASVEEYNGASYVVPSFYMVKTGQNEHDRAQIEGGVYRYASIGFRFDSLICDLCGKDYYGGECPHLLGEEYDGRTATATYGGDLRKVEALEGSIVFLGAQYGAEISKWTENLGVKVPAKPLVAKIEEDKETMELKEQVDRLTAENNELIEKVLALESQLAVLVPLSEDGMTYRVDLLEEGKRLAKLVGQEESYAPVFEVLKDAPAAQLKAVVGNLQKLWDEKFPPKISVEEAAEVVNPLKANDII